MKSKISIAIGFAAVAAVAYIGMKPAEAKADIGPIKEALSKQKKIHAVTVNSKDQIVREAWMGEGKLVIDRQGKVQVIRVQGVPLGSNNAPITVQGAPLKRETSVDVLLDFETPLKPAAKGADIQLFVGKSTGADLEFEGEIFVVPDKASPNTRRVIATDRKTKLPLEIQLQQKLGKTWQSVAKTRFDYTKKAPGHLLESGK